MSTKKVYLAASGDARGPANRLCWPTQSAMEAELTATLNELGVEVERLHAFDEQSGHGFLDSQKSCLDAFREIDRTIPIVVAEAVWQYSHHILAGLIDHGAPILTAANWSGQWPGLVGMLNLNGCLIKAGVPFSTIAAEDFTEAEVREKLHTWLETGELVRDFSHCRPYESCRSVTEGVGRQLADDFRRDRAIMGVFDEGCMGMYNAIIPDELLFPLGVFKERLSQSALLFAMSEVSGEEAEAVFTWLTERGFQFDFDHGLTREQVIEQCRMYVAATRMADDFGCDTFGIQYQLGLKDMCVASDLVEGLLNNSERPPVARADGSIILDGAPFPHFNEVDECAGLDALLINRVHKALGQPLETTLHDLRWGDIDRSGTTDDYVWVLEISGAAPPAHHIGGIAGSRGNRQPEMYFPKGGAGCSGIAKPGHIIWSRIFVADGGLKMDIGLGHVAELPEEETQRRLDSTTREWPIMHGVFHGVSREQMMGRHASNHVQVVYADDARSAQKALLARSAMAHSLGIEVTHCGDIAS